MLSAAYVQVHLRLDSIMEANTMNLLREQSDLGPYCLQYMLTKMGEQTTKEENNLSSPVHLQECPNIFSSKCPEKKKTLLFILDNAPLTIYYGYPLELPLRGNSNGYPWYMY